MRQHEVLSYCEAVTNHMLFDPRLGFINAQPRLTSMHHAMAV